MDRLHRVMAGGIAVIGCGLWSSPSLARTAQPTPLLVTKLFWRPSVAELRFPAVSERLDMSAPVAGRERDQKLGAGPFEGTLRLSRIRGEGAKEASWPLATDRFTTKSARLSIGANVLPDWRLAVEGELSLTRRHVERVPTGSRPLTMATVELGLAAAHDGFGSIALAYVDTMPRGRRRPFDRMAELLGGAPLAGKGLRLSVSQSDDQARTGFPRWTFALASMRRPQADAELTAGRSRSLDTRVELGLKIGF